MSLLSIGIGGYASSRDTSDTLFTSSLGSCVAICFYDKQLSMAGLAHVQLPDSAINPRPNPKKPACFADRAVTLMLDDFQQHGSDLSLACYLIGGASMTSKHLDAPDYFNIGAQNTSACKSLLQEAGIKITAEDLGGHRPRSVHFQVEDGSLNVVSLNNSYAL